MINNNDVNFAGNYQCLSNFVLSPSASKVLSFLIQKESLTSQWILSPTLTTNPKMFYIMFPLAKRLCYRIVHFASSTTCVVGTKCHRSVFSHMVQQLIQSITPTVLQFMLHWMLIVLPYLSLKVVTSIRYQHSKQFVFHISYIRFPFHKTVSCAFCEPVIILYILILFKWNDSMVPH